MKNDNKRFWRLYRQLQILIIWPFFLFMIFQNLLYGLFISKLKEQSFLLDFFFFPGVEDGLLKKKRGMGSWLRCANL